MGLDIATIGQEAAGGAATTAANGIVGGLMGMLLEGHNDRRQIRQQQKLQDMQINGQNQLADAQAKRQLQMWKDTSYPAQVEQMKAAGVNPALMYGIGGGGGQTTGGSSATSVTGGQAPSGGREVMDMQNQMLNNQLLAAQTANLQAQAKKANAEAEKTSGADTDLAQTQIASLTQGISNQKTVQQLQQVETALKETETAFAQDSYEDRLNQITLNVNRGIQELRSATAQGTIDETTVPDRLKIIQQLAINGVLNNTLTEAKTTNTRQDTRLKGAQQQESNSRTNVNNQEVYNLIADIQQKWRGLDLQATQTQQGAQKLNIETYKANTDRFKATLQQTIQDWQMQHPQWQSTVGGMLNDMKQKIDKILDVKY